MKKVYLMPQEALRALADGKVLENEDGCEILLDDDQIVMRYTFGKHNTLVSNVYSDSYADLFMFVEGEEPDGP
jgi:hypothetical protein